ELRWGEHLVGATWSASAAGWRPSARVSRNVASATLGRRAAEGEWIDVEQTVEEAELAVERGAGRLVPSIGVQLQRRHHRNAWQSGQIVNPFFSPRTPGAFDIDSSLQTVAAFGALAARSERTRLDVGVRLTTAAGGRYAAPRIHVSRELSHRWSVSAAGERRIQFTTILDEPEPGSIIQPLYLLDRPRRADAVALGIQHRTVTEPGVGGGSFELTAFARRFPDRPLLQDDPLSLALAGQPLPERFPRFRRVRGYATGATLAVIQPLPAGWLVQGGYTFQRAVERFDGTTSASAWDAPHSLSLYVNAPLWGKWTLTTTSQLRSGAAATPVVLRVFAPGPPLGGDDLVSRYVYGARNSVRLPGYARVDAGARRQWTGVRGSEWSLSLQVINVFARENVMMYDWRSYYCWRAGECSSPGAARRGIPIVPTASLEIRW
ncbi:MAG TPA: TonB-dependent receptor, partial [Gemmatimonadaceae bacterium]|nr:TonB-dependent receptor [Gemmatimonadaceae bacterium]